MQVTYELSEIDSIASQVITQTKSNLLLFYGTMGVGKTTLIKAIAKQLGIEQIASSPTFSIVNEYSTPQGKRVYHFDFYRVNNQEEALDLGFEEYVSQGDWIFIEWPEKIAQYLPTDAQDIRINEINEGRRELILQ